MSLSHLGRVVVAFGEIRGAGRRAFSRGLKACLLYAAALLFTLPRLTLGTQADDTTITIAGQTPGVTPFISQLNLTASETSVIKSLQFTVAPKPGSVTRPLSGTYTNAYLTERGYLLPASGEIFLPVYGLYADFSNTVTLTYRFLDGSSKEQATMVTTAAFTDPCGYDNPIVLLARTDNTALSYDYIMLKGRCDTYSPGIIDTDGALRWVGTGGFSHSTASFYDNAVFQTASNGLYRIDLDGTVTPVFESSDIGIAGLHHNIDRGKIGLLVEANTATQTEAVILEIDPVGNVLKTWDMAAIIGAAMIAGGDDPSEFVFPKPDDWFHSNSATYNRADDSVIISSRENFVIALDYETSAIKWILGDPTKKWHQFPSLAKFALALSSGSLPPIGQHSVSIAYDQNLLLLDNGYNSLFHVPAGTRRLWAAPRKYQLDLDTMVATEVWNYEKDQSIYSRICGSIYEDAPLNYLIDYAFEDNVEGEITYARISGLDAGGEEVFDYRYPTIQCYEIFSAIPLHLENTGFPTIEPRALNISTRGIVGADENSLIGGFIVAGSASQTVVLRALGPSLSDSGVTDAVADPVLTLFDSSGTVVGKNDDWETDPGAAQISADGLAPNDPAEAATMQTLAPGAYTFVVTGKNSLPGIGLIEAYDLSPHSGSRLANISTRALVGSGDSVLISGFIIGDVASATVVARAIGPSLLGAGIGDPLNDPTLTVYDSHGTAIASNDNWQDDASATEIEQNDLAPIDDAESATMLHLPAGAYTIIVTGFGETTGVGLVEVYDLE